MKVITKYLREDRSFKKTNSVKALVQRGNYILLVRRQLDAPGAGQWDLPGGHIEDGENKKDALKRETFEETGLKIDNIKYITKVNLKIPESGVDSDMNIFKCDAEDIGVDLKPADWEGSDGRPEHIEYKWVENKIDVENLPMLDILKKEVLKHLK